MTKDRFAYAPRFGANLVTPDRVRFALWAPDCGSVALEIPGRDPVPMRAEPGGRFLIEAECRPGTRYRYRVHPDLAVPDPAARVQDGDVHDASVVVDPAAYVWKNGAWRGRPWHESVLYEVHVGTLGGFKATTRLLPRLVSLGVTALEMMPIGDFPGRRNWGYDGVLPYAPDAAYGTPEDLKALIDVAHGLGLMVFLDVVYNHFGPEGNYLGRYASAFFRSDQATPWGAAIDFSQPEVRRFFIDNALLWILEYRVDGLRLDAVHAISDRAFLRALAREVREAITPDRHVHLVVEDDANDAGLLRGGERAGHFDAQWADDTHHALHVLLTGERHGYYADYRDAAGSLACSLAEGFAYQGEASAFRGGRPRGTRSVDLPPTAFVIFLQNHDQIGNRPQGERLTRLAGPRARRAAVLLLLLAPQIPLLFMGEEWDEERPFLFFTDHPPELARAVRRGRDAELHRRGMPPLPDPNDPATFARSTPRFWCPRTPTEEGMRAFCQTLLRLRARRITPFLPGCRASGARVLDKASVRATWTLGNGATLVIGLNLGPGSCTVQPGNAVPLAMSRPDAFAKDGTLAPQSAAAWLDPP